MELYYLFTNAKVTQFLYTYQYGVLVWVTNNLKSVSQAGKFIYLYHQSVFGEYDIEMIYRIFVNSFLNCENEQ